MALFIAEPNIHCWEVEIWRKKYVLGSSRSLDVKKTKPLPNKFDVKVWHYPQDALLYILGREKMAKKAYFGLGWLISIILAIIPITNIICGIITRLERGKILMAILNFFLFFIFYWVDLISIILNKDIKWLAWLKQKTRAKRVFYLVYVKSWRTYPKYRNPSASKMSSYNWTYYTFADYNIWI